MPGRDSALAMTSMNRAREANRRGSADPILQRGQSTHQRDVIPAKGGLSIDLAGEVVDLRRELISVPGEVFNLPLEVSVNLFLPEEDRPQEPPQEPTGQHKDPPWPLRAGATGVVESEVSHRHPSLDDGPISI